MFLECVVVGLSLRGGATDLPEELVPAARLESRSDNPARGAGIFGDHWWANRFLDRHRLVETYRGRVVDLVMIGDSITHRWEYMHTVSWAKFTSGRAVLNLGYGSDGAQHVMWRILHGELDGYEAKAVALLIGVNNNAKKGADPANVAAAIRKVVQMIRERQPKARILLHAIFPVGSSAASGLAGCRRRDDETNRLLKAFAASDPTIEWIDLESKFVDASGWVPKAMMSDEVHPVEAGYDIWAEALSRAIDSPTKGQDENEKRD